MSAPAWQLEEAKPDWWLEPHEPWYLEPSAARVPIGTRATIYRSTLVVPELIERTAAEGTAVLDVTFAVFNKWQEITDSYGSFLERILPGAFSKTIRENIANIRAILSHGKDPSMGQTVLGKIESIREETDGATARISLFRSVPGLLLDGLPAGQYGASFRGDSIKTHVVERPPKSAHNPKGLLEVTHQEIRLKDVGPTTFPAYRETSSRIGGPE
jgi:phage head maturation protease